MNSRINNFTVYFLYIHAHLINFSLPYPGVIVSVIFTFFFFFNEFKFVMVLVFLHQQYRASRPPTRFSACLCILTYSKPNLIFLSSSCRSCLDFFFLGLQWSSFPKTRWLQCSFIVQYTCILCLLSLHSFFFTFFI